MFKIKNINSIVLLSISYLFITNTSFYVPKEKAELFKEILTRVPEDYILQYAIINLEEASGIDVREKYKYDIKIIDVLLGFEAFMYMVPKYIEWDDLLKESRPFYRQYNKILESSKYNRLDGKILTIILKYIGYLTNRIPALIEGEEPDRTPSEDQRLKALEIFGLEQSATMDQIKSKYKELALLMHPDKPTGSKELFQKLQNAYDCLIKNQCENVF